MHSETISVIIPIYNREKYLERCINSVLDQAGVETEIILIDDGSTDRSPQMIDDYALKSTNIKAVHTANGGVSRARNTGLDIATGGYITFVDSDDYLSPDALCSMKKAMDDNGADYCIGKISFFTDSGELDHTMNLPEHYCNKLLDKGAVWQTLLDVNYPIFDSSTAKLYKKELWDGLRFVEGKTSEDTIALTEIQKRCDTVFFIDQVVYNVTFSPISLLRNASGKTLLNEAEANYLLTDYLSQIGYYEAALRRFGDGTRSLIAANDKVDDPDSKKEISRIYKGYCKVSKALSSHTNARNRVRFLILRFSFPLYCFIRKTKVKTGAAQ